MRIRELNMIHFGKFEEQTVLFHPGVNIICGHNESGKSTIHAFIRAMLFGLEKTRGRSRIGEYELRQPWSNPSWFEGMMKVEHAGRIYRIERNFSGAGKSLHLIDETDGREIEQAEEGLKRILCGLNETAFCNTVFVGQDALPTDAGLGEELKRYLLSVQETGDAGLDVAGALQQLRQLRKEKETDRKRETQKVQEKIEQKKLALAAAKKELDQLQLVTDHHTADPDLMQQDRSAGWQGSGPDVRIFDDEDEKEDMLPEEEGDSDGFAQRKRRRIPFFILALVAAVAGFLSGACALVASGIAFMALMWLLTAGFTVVCAASFYMFFRSAYDDHWQREPDDDLIDETDASAEDDERLDRRIQNDKRNDRRKRLIEQERKNIRRQVLEEEQARKQQTVSQLQKELDSLYREHDRIQEADIEIQALDLAVSRIRENADRICAQIGDGFEQSISEILSALTGGRYTSVSLDERMHVKVNTPDRLLDLEQVSCGAMHQIYFALRMAAAELMDGENLPLILDEAFVMYDDARLRSALEWLDRSPRQVILFTCQKREKRILDQIRNERSGIR